MNVSDRVKTIQLIAAKLSPLGYQEAEFVMEQFGISIKNVNSTDIRGYIINQLKDESDDKLAGLTDHLAENKARVKKPESSVWEPGYFKLFMSHITADKVEVAAIKEALMPKGVSAFVAHEDIRPSKEWQDEIENALNTCDALAAYLTPDFHLSKWTDQEVGFAMSRRVLILPLNMGINPYGFMNKYQAMKCERKDSKQVADAIYDTLLKHDLTSSQITQSLIAALETSDSYSRTQDLIPNIMNITSWTPDMLRRLEAAAENNPNVSGAWYVSGKIHRIVAQNSK